MIDLWPEKSAVLIDVCEIRSAQTYPFELRQALVHKATQRCRLVLERAIERFLSKHLTATSTLQYKNTFRYSNNEIHKCVV